MNLKITLLLVLACFTSFTGCKKNNTTSSTKKAAIDVSTSPVVIGDIQEYFTFNGITTYQRKEDIRANVTGYITQLHFKIGDKIGAGQVFASVRTKEQDALRDAVKIDSSLSKFIGSISIKSNATGIIKTLAINKNDYVAEGDILASIVQPKSLVVQVNVPFEFIDKVKIGSLCEILIPNGDSLKGTITDILPSVDLQSQSQTYLIKLPDAALPEGLNVQIKTLNKENRNVLTIPKTALQTNELLTKYWVLKVEHDTLAVKTPVTPSLQNDSIVAIISNYLKAEDKVITQGAYQMQDSTIVKINN